VRDSKRARGRARHKRERERKREGERERARKREREREQERERAKESKREQERVGVCVTEREIQIEGEGEREREEGGERERERERRKKDIGAKEGHQVRGSHNACFLPLICPTQSLMFTSWLPDLEKSFYLSFSTHVQSHALWEAGVVCAITQASTLLCTHVLLLLLRPFVYSSLSLSF